jgi:hypothetical protein
VGDIELVLLARDLTSSTDAEVQAALVTATMTALDVPGQSFTWDFRLESRFEDRDDFVETIVGRGGEIARANSWWSAAKNCVLGSCGTVCIGALTACSGAWAAYLACVAAACGGCWLRCAACATCDCGWFCKPLVGCCRQ